MIGGDEVVYNWGNPANALVVPWSHRTKFMSFYTSEIENQTDAAQQLHYVQVITAKADDGKIKLDNAYIPSTSFQPIGTDMVYANIPLTKHGKHTLTTEGGGFTGFVHGMTSEARAYEYTLGFNPPKYLDSVFIKDLDELNPTPVMSPYTYNLPYMQEKVGISVNWWTSR